MKRILFLSIKDYTKYFPLLITRTKGCEILTTSPTAYHLAFPLREFDKKYLSWTLLKTFVVVVVYPANFGRNLVG